MAQEREYFFDGRKDAGEYYLRGEKGERRAYSKAFADARSDNNNWYNNKGYMENVGKGSIKYDHARWRDDADAESRKYNPKLGGKKKAKKSAKKKSARRK